MAARSLTPALAALTEAELERLARVAERLLAGRTRLLPGPHAVRRRAGNGGEFLDHRPYWPGDDLRAVDWRASLRSRELQVRRYQDEAAGDWFICLDRSASMSGFDGAKWALTLQLAAAWAYLLLHLDHRVGLLTFSSRVDDLCPPGRGHDHYGRALRWLHTVTPRPQGGSSMLGACATVVGQRAAVLVLSDFLCPDGMQAGLARLAGRELYAVQILAATELPPPDDAPVTLQDVETRQRLNLFLGSQERALAVAALHRLQENLASYCRRQGIAFTPCDTRQHWREIVLDQLRRLQVS